MNRAELEDRIAAYLHRTDLAGDIPGWIEFATQRIGRDLRSDWNYKYESLSISAVPYELPADLRELRSVIIQRNGGPMQLRSIPSHEFSKVGGSGTPAWYVVRGRDLDVAPFQADDYELGYWYTPETLTVGADTNDVLENYSFIYLYACLFEGAIFLQDPTMELKYREIYLQEVSMINTESAKRRQGDAPAMRAV